MRTASEEMDGVGSFRKIGKVGVGSYGNILLCERSSGERVALKKICYNEEAINEAKLLSSLRHANIIEMEEVFKSERALYIVLEFMEGGTLDSLIRKRNGKPFDHTVIVRYTVQLSQALEYVHERRIIHRDVKPMNVLLNKEQTVAKLGDFGVSVQLREEEVSTRGKKGTSPYMAPEVLEGDDYDTKADMFSMGCLLYEMVELRRAFTGSSDLAIQHRICNGSYTLSTNAVFGPLIRMLLSRSPSSRPSAVELVSIVPSLSPV